MAGDQRRHLLNMLRAVITADGEEVAIEVNQEAVSSRVLEVCEVPAQGCGCGFLDAKGERARARERDRDRDRDPRRRPRRKSTSHSARRCAATPPTCCFVHTLSLFFGIVWFRVASLCAATALTSCLSGNRFSCAWSPPATSSFTPKRTSLCTAQRHILNTRSPVESTGSKDLAVKHRDAKVLPPSGQARHARPPVGGRVVPLHAPLVCVRVPARIRHIGFKNPHWV